MGKPDVDLIEGLSPAISIEQKTTSKNPRSTVGTVTEIHDYMRLLWARVGIPYSPVTGLPIESQTVSQMVDKITALPDGERLLLLAPVVRDRKGEYRKEIGEWQRAGYPAPEDRRRILSHRGRADPRQEVQARHRHRGGPHRHQRRPGAADGGLDPDRAGAGGRHRRGRMGGQGSRAKSPAASSSPRNSPARSPASPSPRSSRACSPSTPRPAPAPPATAWARS